VISFGGEQGNSMAPLTLQTGEIVCRRGEEHALFRRYRRHREPAVRDALIARFLPLALHLARRYPSGRESQDVAQVASLALVKAVDRFEPDRGAAFTSFATPTILGEIKRYFRDFGWTVHVPRQLQERVQLIERVAHTLSGRLGRAPTPAELAAELDISVEQVLDALATATAHRPEPLEPDERDGDEARRPAAAVEESGYDIVEDADAVASLLSCLSDRDRLVVELRFRHDLLQREIADVVGLSQMQISRILTHSLAKLRDGADERKGPDGPAP
jgi:RNA polymerase sigma-B factor